MADPLLNDNGHTENCPGNSTSPYADPNSAYIDFFCDDCHSFAEPRILSGGTSIAWPSGWSEDRARAWRTEHHLIPPDVGD